MQHNDAGDDGERGVIVNTASVAAYEGQIGQAAYSASKGGVVGMTLPMAREFVALRHPRDDRSPRASSGRRWSTACPTAVQQSLSASIPFPSRLGQPEEFADLVAYILGNTLPQRRDHPPRRRHAPRPEVTRGRSHIALLRKPTRNA